MLTILSFGAFVCGFAILLIFSSENTAGQLIFLLGFFILLPLAVLTAILSAALPLLGRFVPAATEWSMRLGAYVDGGYGVPGSYYLIGSVLVLLIGSVYIADNDEDESDDSETTKSTETESKDNDQNGREKPDIGSLSDIGGIESEGAKRIRDAGFDSVTDVASASPDELTTVDGLDLSSAKELKSRLGGTTSQEDRRADTIDFEEPSDKSKPEAVGRAKKSETNLGDVEKSEEEESENKAETGTTAESHTQEESESDEISDESGFKYSAGREGGQIESGSDETSDDDSSETAEYDELTEINGIDSTKAEELYQAGYESVDDLREARRRKLANIVGSALTSLIKADVRSQDSDGEVEVSKSSTADKEGQSESASGQDDIDKEVIEHLLELPDVDKPKAESLFKNGFTSREDLQTAASSEIADTVGHGTMVSIRKEVGFVDQTSTSTNSPTEAETSASSSNNIDKSKQSSTSSSEFNWESDSSINDSESNSTTTESARTNQQLVSDKQTLVSQLDDTVSNSFQNTDSTRKQLIRCHKQAAELGERAQEASAEDILAFAESTLTDIEQKLEALSAISESLRDARSRVSPEELPSETIGISDLKSARKSYSTAIDRAKETEFDTAKLEQERAEIISAIEDRTEEPEIADSPQDSTPKEESKSDDVSDVSDESPTRDDLIEELTHLDETVEGYPLTTDLREGGKYTQHDYIAEFGSWEDALSAANINKKQRLIDEIHRVKDIVDEIPNTTDMDEYSTHSSGTYSTTFGSWDAALEAAGIDVESDSENHTQTVEPNTQTGTDTSDSDDDTTQSDSTKQEYISALQEFAQTTDDVIKSTDFKDYSGYSVQTIVATFGSWHDALEEADVDNKSRLLDELRRVAEKIGHQPSTTEMNKHGTVSATLYSDYFGSYTEAKQQAFGDHNDFNSGSDTTVSGQKFARISDVTEDGRLSDPIALKICYELDDTSDKKDTSLEVEDLGGNRCWLHIWRTHDIDMAWEKDHWYVLTDLRGKQWTDKHDDTKRQLSSTNDLQFTHIGDSPPTETNVIETTSDPNPTQSDESEESTDIETGNGDDADDILNEIMTEFEDVSED